MLFKVSKDHYTELLNVKCIMWNVDNENVPEGQTKVKVFYTNNGGHSSSNLTQEELADMIRRLEGFAL